MVSRDVWFKNSQTLIIFLPPAGRYWVSSKIVISGIASIYTNLGFKKKDFCFSFVFAIRLIFSRSCEEILLNLKYLSKLIIFSGRLKQPFLTQTTKALSRKINFQSLDSDNIFTNSSFSLLSTLIKQILKLFSLSSKGQITLGF